jgi:hypothetical protein
MKHYITNFNIKDVELQKKIKTSFPNGIDFCYTDPPWNNLKYWKTLNNKMTGGDSELISQNELESVFAKIIVENVKNYAFIVYGVREMQSAVDEFKKYSNVKDIQLYKKTYKSGSKNLTNVVICITLNNAPILDWSDLQSLAGIKGLQYVCDKFKGKYTTCLELFIGIGYYLKVLNDNGFTVIGNELNSARLKKALSKI